jgi:hypothetical protein
MSWWIVVYLGLFGVLAVAGLWDDYCDRRPAWFLGCAVISNLTIICLFVAFWNPPLHSILGGIAPVLFIASTCWELFQAVEDLRNQRADPQLSKSQERLAGIVTALVLPLISLPAIVVAGIDAFSR